jgi:hypothetical protein
MVGILIRLIRGPLSSLHATFWCIISSASVTMVGEILIAINIFRIYLVIKVGLGILSRFIPRYVSACLPQQYEP